VSPQFLIQPQLQQQQQQQQQQQIPVQTESSSKAENSIVLNKLELINDKIDSLKQITHLNNQNMPSMETNVLLQNIQRIVKENEQYKKDLYDKSNKIEEQNAKITELLMKAQNYVEQSHQILELKNTAFQSNAEKTVNKVLELEQDKMRLTGDLSKLTAQISELNLEVNKMQKNEADLKQQLIEVSKNTDTHKQTSERLLVENADLQTKLDTVLAEYKKERQLRKSFETKVNLNEEELNELRSNLNTNQRVLDEKKRKNELDKAQFDRELDEMKTIHVRELAELKERLNTFKTKGSELQNEQIKQVNI
jgi:FK506-binding protein 15